MIVSGSIDANSPIREAELARRLGVSRTPVREALNRLQAEKLLDSLPSGGYRVVQFSAADLEELYAVRAVLEGLAASLAAKNMGRVAAASLEDDLEAMELAANSRDDVELARLNSKFHSTVAAASGNKFLQSLLLSIQDIFERYRMPAIANDARRASSFAEHRQIADALIRRDHVAAEQLIKNHIGKALELRQRTLAAQEPNGTAARQDS